MDFRYLAHVGQGFSLALKIYDASGKLVKSFNPESCILNRESIVVWDGTDDSGTKVETGIYFVELKTGLSSLTKKIIYTK